MSEQQADFNIRSLGSFYFPDKTLFRVYAPDYSELDLVIKGRSYAMHRNGACFEIAISGDLEKAGYHFEGDGVSFRDPFSYLDIGKESIVLNRKKFLNETIVPVNGFRTPIIYECSVRDFSADRSFTGKHKKKFLGLSEEGLKIKGQPIGLDHLVYLGITHLQLMPILEFDYDKSTYNWGYNPIAYNYVQKDFVHDQKDPYAYINELRKTVNILHKKGIRVTLDVVFNHVYDHKKNDLGKMLKGRLYRYKDNGEIAQGSLCGNEVKSEDPFVRVYFVEMVTRYLKLYDIDGIRMDLMGMLDIETINAIRNELCFFKKDFLVYGEGWNMGDVLPEGERASINNYRQLPGVRMFNDFFRDTIINYISGNNEIKEEVKRALAANEAYLDQEHTLNYVECHDNYTMIDRMNLYKSDEPKWLAAKRCKLALSLLLIARGAPFIHMGEEFNRTKYGLRDSYNSGDHINAIDWELRVENAQLCDYVRDLIRIRKENSCFDDPETTIDFYEYYECLVFRLGTMKIIINPTVHDYVYDDGQIYDVIFSERGACDYRNNLITVSSVSLVICKL